jgi:tetratricopeptide (TPR) repeat protein
VWAGLLLTATLLAYRPAWNGSPVWDDDVHMTSPALRSLDGLVQSWALPRGPVQYFPLVRTVFWLQSHLWGDSTPGYHLLNILLHVVSALLLVRILRKLEVRGAWLAGAIFALHPVMVESVAWISELKNTLSGVFFLSASLTYLAYTETGKRRSYLSALGLFVLGLLSKTTIAPFPLAMLAVIWWKRGRLSWRRDITPLLPFFLAGILLGLTTLYVERSHIGTREPELEFSFVERCLIAGRAIWFYLGKVFLPVNLTISYPRWVLNATVWWQYLFPAAALVAGFISWTMRKTWRAPATVCLYFTVMLLPFLGFFSFFTFRYSFAADHYQYLAAIGPIVMGAGLLEMALDSTRGGRGILKTAVSVMLLLMLGALSWKQSGMYSDAETLYQTTITRNDRSWMAHNNLGIVLANMGRTDEAAVHYQKALELKPDHADAYYNLGHLLAKMGQTDEALAHYQKALEIDPNHAKAHINLGGLFEDVGRAGEALAHYSKASEIDPNDSGIQYNLGSLLEDMGRPDEAMAHYQKALILTPNHTETHYNLGHLLARMGRIDEAMVHYQQALELRPNHADAHNNLGILLASRGRADEAIAHFRKASELDPQSIGFLKNLAAALSQQGQLTDAKFILTRALALSKSAGDEVQEKAITQMRAKLNETIDSSRVDSNNHAQY